MLTSAHFKLAIKHNCVINVQQKVFSLYTTDRADQSGRAIYESCQLIQPKVPAGYLLLLLGHLIDLQYLPTYDCVHG